MSGTSWGDAPAEQGAQLVSIRASAVEQAGPRVVAAGLASTQAAVPVQGEIPAAVVRQDELAAVVRQDERVAERAGLQACLALALASSRAELQVDFPDEPLPDDSLEQDAFPAAVASPVASQDD
jgi:hypothetical protein